MNSSLQQWLQSRIAIEKLLWVEYTVAVGGNQRFSWGNIKKNFTIQNLSITNNKNISCKAIQQINFLKISNFYIPKSREKNIYRF